MRFVYLFLAALLTTAIVRGHDRPINVTPPKGWSETGLTAKEKGPGAFLTLKLVPDDHRNASVLITVIGRGGKINDLTSLRGMHAMQCQQYAETPDQKFDVKELKLAHGIAVYSFHEDPDLIGKPAPPNEFKVATPVAMLLDDTDLIHITIFTDEVAGPTMTEALQLVASIAPNLAQSEAGKHAPAQPIPSIVIAVPGLDTELSLPSAGLRKGLDLKNERNYFILTNDKGVTISGWLEPVSRYKGFRAVWTEDKAKMISDGFMKIEDETMKVINGWQAVTYTVVVGDMRQPNIRACRTSGNTWLDVHLSATPGPDAKHEMDAVLRTLAVYQPDKR